MTYENILTIINSSKFLSSSYKVSSSLKILVYMLLDLKIYVETLNR